MPLENKLPPPPELYCITDPRLSGLSHEEQTTQMLAGGARLIQLRDKTLGDDEFLAVAKKCRTLCSEQNAAFIVNDRVEIAVAIGADGAHIGQEDITPTEARRLLGDEAILGISTHTRDQFHRALGEPVTYIALGPVFGTTTKERPDPIPGMDLVREAFEALRNDPRPLVLIGGITLGNLAELQRIAPGVFYAVVGAIVRKEYSIPERVRLFRTIIQNPQ